MPYRFTADLSHIPAGSHRRAADDLAATRAPQDPSQTAVPPPRGQKVGPRGRGPVQRRGRSRPWPPAPKRVVIPRQAVGESLAAIAVGALTGALLSTAGLCLGATPLPAPRWAAALMGIGAGAAAHLWATTVAPAEERAAATFLTVQSLALEPLPAAWAGAAFAAARLSLCRLEDPSQPSSLAAPRPYAA